MTFPITQLVDLVNNTSRTDFIANDVRISRQDAALFSMRVLGWFRDKGLSSTNTKFKKSAASVPLKMESFISAIPDLRFYVHIVDGKIAFCDNLNDADRDNAIRLVLERYKPHIHIMRG